MALNVTEMAVSKRPLLKLMGKTKARPMCAIPVGSKKQERYFFKCEFLLQRQIRKVFLHRILTGDEKWSLYDNSKHRKSWRKPGQPVTSIKKLNIHCLNVMLCIRLDKKGVVYQKLLNQVKPLLVVGCLYK